MNLFFPAPKTYKLRKTSGKRKSPEHDLQVRLVRAINASSRHLNWAVPNGGYRHLLTATKLRAEGVRRGIPDLHFVLPPSGRLACLELKSESGRLSPEQKNFRDRLLADGGLWEVANSFDEAWGVLAAWGVVPSAVKRV